MTHFFASLMTAASNEHSPKEETISDGEDERPTENTQRWPSLIGWGFLVCSLLQLFTLADGTSQFSSTAGLFHSNVRKQPYLWRNPIIRLLCYHRSLADCTGKTIYRKFGTSERLVKRSRMNVRRKRGGFLTSGFEMWEVLFESRISKYTCMYPS